MSTQYREGEIYFRLTFPDARLSFPQIETLVFIGKNLGDESLEDAWYFEFSDSYARSTAFTMQQGAERRVCIVTERDLPEMLDMTGLVRELNAASDRRKQA